VQIARDMIARVRELTRTITGLYEQLAGLVKQIAPHLLAETGLGVLIAAKLIGEIAGIDRFTSDAQLARISGCAPIPVSSGRTDRHRLDPGGNRQLNHAFHMLALTKIMLDPQTAAYLAKQRRAGKTNTEAIRCLKRHLVRRVYHLLRDPSTTPVTVCLTQEPSAKWKTVSVADAKARLAAPVVSLGSAANTPSSIDRSSSSRA
jgi:transposase